MVLDLWRKISVGFNFTGFSNVPHGGHHPLPVSKVRMNSDINEIFNKIKKLDSGEVADYIPELAKTNPDYYSVVVMTAEGEVFAYGDSDVKFPIESIVKPFVFSIVLDEIGSDLAMKKIGAEATGLPFNSFMADGVRNQKIQNPLVNMGAIQTVSLISEKDPSRKWSKILKRLSQFAGKSLNLNEKVYLSESSTNSTNRKLASFLFDEGLLYDDMEHSLDIYTKACSVDITTKDLAAMGAVLANGGRHPITKKRVMDKSHIDEILSVMTIAGLYDGSGRWLYQVGLPAKSGVGGGLLAIVPGKLSIAVFSPKLNSEGNSVKGIESIKSLSEKWKLHIFH